MFIDREQELRELRTLLDEVAPQLALLYGRRDLIIDGRQARELGVAADAA
jgi:hypothetical protein